MPKLVFRSIEPKAKSGSSSTSVVARNSEQAGSPIHIDLTGDMDEGLAENCWCPKHLIPPESQSHWQSLSPSQSQGNLVTLQDLLVENRYLMDGIGQLKINESILKGKCQYLEAENQALQDAKYNLRQENEELKRINKVERAEASSLVKDILACNAIIEAAVDAREAKMQVGLRNMGGTVAQVRKQVSQMLDFSKNTSSLVSRLVVGAMAQHQDIVNNVERELMQFMTDNAEHLAELSAMIDEDLPFMASTPKET